MTFSEGHMSHLWNRVFFQGKWVPFDSWNELPLVCEAGSSNFSGSSSSWESFKHFWVQNWHGYAGVTQFFWGEVFQCEIVLVWSSNKDILTKKRFITCSVHTNIQIWHSETFGWPSRWRRTWKIQTSNLADQWAIIWTAKGNSSLTLNKHDFTSGTYDLRKISSIS